MKRVFSLVLVLVLLIGLVPVTTRAASAVAITSQPKSVSVAEGEKATVTVKATGDGLIYTWYYLNKGESKYQKTTSFTGPTYSVVMNVARDGRKVRCIVKDKYGNSVTTVAATLSMDNGPKIISQTNVAVAAKGEKATVTIKATGEGLTYTWYYMNKGESKYSKTNSFKGNTYSVVMDASRAGRKVKCIVKDKYGNSVTTAAATLIMGNKVKITSQPTSVAVNKGETAKVTVGATGDGLTYTWYYLNKGESKYTKTDSFKGNTYAVTMTAARDGRKVICQVKDKYGNSIKTNAVTLLMTQKVTDFVTITRNPIDREAVEGSDVSFNVTASGSGDVTYQWQHRTTPTGSWTNSKLPGNQTSIITVTATAERNGFQYRCKVTSGSAVAYTDPATLTVKSAVSITTQPADVRASAYGEATFSVGAVSDKPITYLWQYRDGSTGEWTALVYQTESVMTITVGGQDKVNGRQFRCAVTANGQTVYSRIATLTVYKELDVTPNGSGGHVEESYVVDGESFNLECVVTGGCGGVYSYKWYRKGDVFKTGEATDGSKVVLTDVMDKSLANSDGYVSYSLLVKDGDGNYAFSAEFQVHPHTNIYFNTPLESQKGARPKDQYDRVLEIFSLDVMGGNPEYITYQWQYSLDKNTWTDITPSTVLDNGPASFVLYNNEDQIGNISYLYCSYIRANDTVKDNGGVWLRCVVTDTLLNRSITSNVVGWSIAMNISVTKSGSYCYAVVDGGLGNHTYEWRGYQGQWYPQSTSVSCEMEPSRFNKYRIYVTDEAGFTTYITIDATTGQVIAE